MSRQDDVDQLNAIRDEAAGLVQHAQELARAIIALTEKETGAGAKDTPPRGTHRQQRPRHLHIVRGLLIGAGLTGAAAVWRRLAAATATTAILTAATAALVAIPHNTPPPVRPHGRRPAIAVPALSPATDGDGDGDDTSYVIRSPVIPSAAPGPPVSAGQVTASPAPQTSPPPLPSESPPPCLVWVVGVCVKLDPGARSPH